MKIYTRTGDGGETGLMGGKRISKASLRVAAYGDVDELNAVLGICLAELQDRRKQVRGNMGYVSISGQKSGWNFLRTALEQIQRDLFAVGADLSMPLSADSVGSDNGLDIPRPGTKHVVQLEEWIDHIEEQLTPLKNFIVPGGSLLASHLHLARTVCRRAERTIVAAGEREKMNQHIIIYMNRLSDLFFMMARYANFLQGEREERWSGG